MREPRLLIRACIPKHRARRCAQWREQSCDSARAVMLERLWVATDGSTGEVNMNRKPNTILLLGALLSALCASPPRSRAQDAYRPASHRSSSLHADVELDPIAYALEGHSLHVGVGYKRLRVDLGAFALDLPPFMEPVEGFDTSFSGYGLKLQYFPFAEQSGAFVGLDANLAHAWIEATTSDAAHRQTRWSLGVLLGWRFMLGAGFYATPWVGASYDFNAGEFELDSRRYEAPAFSPFATLHLGYRFM
jgi:hypothetical protein